MLCTKPPPPPPHNQLGIPVGLTTYCAVCQSPWKMTSFSKLTVLNAMSYEPHTFLKRRKHMMGSKVNSQQSTNAREFRTNSIFVYSQTSRSYEGVFWYKMQHNLFDCIHMCKAGNNLPLLNIIYELVYTFLRFIRILCHYYNFKISKYLYLTWKQILHQLLLSHAHIHRLYQHSSYLWFSLLPKSQTQRSQMSLSKLNSP